MLPAPSPVFALSPLDGRYQANKALQQLRPLFSEGALMRLRLQVEIHWLIEIIKGPQQSLTPPLAPLSSAQQQRLLDLVTQFSAADAEAIKVIEAETRHDVKALEYWIKQKLAAAPDLLPYLEWVHFACTSEDINNCAYALALQAGRDSVLLPLLDSLCARLQTMVGDYAALPMLARTHGQPASPTTLGKELANVLHRLGRARQRFASVAITAKLNGAVGNWNAHLAAFPDYDWPAFSQQLIENKLGLSYQAFSTQIEPHDSLAQYLDAIAHINTIALDFARDVWGYVALGYFGQKKGEKEVGSSTMPHKINPIDFENAEGNLGIANALLRFMADKLPLSRWQRDLSDSTVLRNLGVACGHSALAWDNLSFGLGKLYPNQAVIAADLAASPEVLAEAIQTVMRKYGLPTPYERLKDFTQGQAISAQMLRDFISTLELPAAEKQSLLALTPERYTGLATTLAQSLGAAE